MADYIETLPFELKLAILSKLPPKTLWSLNLSKKMYFWLYKSKYPESAARWDPDVCWLTLLAPLAQYRCSSKKLYVYTLTDLAEQSPCVISDVIPGLYELSHIGENGYIFHKKPKDDFWLKPKRLRTTRGDNSKYLRGTYWGGAISRLANPELFRLFDQLEKEATIKVTFFDMENIESLEHVGLGDLGQYHNYPLLFFSNQELSDLTKLSFRYHLHVGKLNLWHIYSEKEYVGVAVLAPEFGNLAGDQMGLAYFRDDNNDIIAFGTWDFEDEPEERENVDIDDEESLDGDSDDDNSDDDNSDDDNSDDDNSDDETLDHAAGQ